MSEWLGYLGAVSVARQATSTRQHRGLVQDLGFSTLIAIHDCPSTSQRPVLWVFSRREWEAMSLHCTHYDSS